MNQSAYVNLLAGIVAIGLAAPALGDPSMPAKDAAPAAAPAGPTPTSAEAAKIEALRKAWAEAKTQIFAGKMRKPDAEDPDTVNHMNWYEATGYIRPYPGEKTVRPPTDFPNRFKGNRGDND